MKTSLVLGANGFVGSHLVDGLVERGFKVKAFDKYSSNIEQFKPHDHIQPIKGDINDIGLISEAMSETEYLFHCFSATTPSTAESDPYSDITDNLLHAIRIFELAVDKGVKKIIFISSGGAVYGTATEKGEVDESTNPEPVSPYGICKLAIEHYLAYYKRKHDMDYVVYRLTNPYGPRQITKHGQGVIPTFIDSIVNDKPLNVYGDGSMTRDYIYITDAVDMMLKGFEPNSHHDTYNIGSGTQTSLTEIIKAIEGSAGRNAKVTHLDVPSTFLHKTPVSIKRFESDFGKQTLLTIIEGLDKTLKG